MFLIWSDALPPLSIGQPLDRRQKGKRCQTHTTCIDQWIILAHVQILLDFGAIHIKFHDRINQRLISFQSTIPKTAQGDKCFCASWQFAKLYQNSNKCPRSTQGAYFGSRARPVNQHIKISKGLSIDVPNHLLCFQHAWHCVQKARGCRLMLHTYSVTFSTRIITYKKQRAP
jgi:hypothetical protein